MKDCQSQILDLQKVPRRSWNLCQHPLSQSLPGTHELLKTNASSPVVEQVELLASLEESKHQGGIVWHLNVMILERNSPSLSLGWVNWSLWKQGLI